MEPPAKRQRLSPPVEQQHQHESSSDDDFYAPAISKEQPKQQAQAPGESDVDDEVEILDEGEEVEDIDEAEVNIRRAQSLNKVRSKWDEICEKYGREFENADEIDLNTLEVVVDKGHISQMRDENDVGNGQPTPKRERLGAQNVVDHVSSLPKNEDGQQQIYRDPLPSKSLYPPQAQQTVYEDESSDDDFLYEKPAPSVVLAPRQPQGINQVKSRGGSRTVVEKRTVITTRRITTSTIRNDRSSSKDENGRQRSHERTSREIQRYTTSSQEKIVETSSDDELVQRSPPHQPAQIQDENERPPSPKGKVSLWAPRMKAGRPRLAYDERGTPQRHVSRRDRTPRYDEHGRKIRKQRNDRGKMRKPEHLRKTKFVQRYPHLHQESENSVRTDFSSPMPLEKPHAALDRADSSMSIPITTSEEALKPLVKPVMFERNKVDKSYEFSDEEDDALPQRPLPSLLTVHSADVFPRQDTAHQAEKALQPKDDAGYGVQHNLKEHTPLLELPLSPPPPYTEYEYQPSHVGAYNPSLDPIGYPAPMAPMSHMETLHGFLPTEDDSHDTSGFMETYLSLPEVSGPDNAEQYEAKPIQDAPHVEESKLESEDDLPIPIDPALLALDAENRAASLERAVEFAAASDSTEETGMKGTSVPTSPYEDLMGYKASLEEGGMVLGVLDDEDDSDEDLFAPQPPATAPRSMIGEEPTLNHNPKVDEVANNFEMVAGYGEEPTATKKTSLIIHASGPEIMADRNVNDPVPLMKEESQATVVSEEKERIAKVRDTEIMDDEDDLNHSALPMEHKIEPRLTTPWAETSPIRKPARIEVPDSDADSEDELLTQPSSQAPPQSSRLMITSSQPGSSQATPRSKEALKRVHFSANLILDETPKPKLSPTPTYILGGTRADQIVPSPSPPSFEPQTLSDPAEVIEDDEDDLALVPSTPAARTKSRTKAALESAPTSRSMRPASRLPSFQPSESSASIEQPRRNELASSQSILKPPSSSRSRSSTPQQPTKPSFKSTSTSRATPPRLFSLSVSPQPVPKHKLRASLLSESASTTPRRAATATPPPQPAISSGVRRRGAVGRLLSASPSLGIRPPGQKRPREDWS